MDTEKLSAVEKRKSALQDYIRRNPHSSTLEREQLRELEEEERREKSKPGEVLY